MRRNIEIKARITNPQAVQALIEMVADSKPELLSQEDTFFHSPKGRLKVRVFGDASGQLIYYKRSNRRGPRQSRYQLFRLVNPDDTKRWFAAMFGVKGIVRKRRVLYKVGKTRIHLDSVDTLGDFIELEVVLDNGDHTETGKEIADTLMNKLNIDRRSLISCAYADLLFAQRRKARVTRSFLATKSPKRSFHSGRKGIRKSKPGCIQKTLF